MRIRELLENKIFNEKDFVKHSGDKLELDYDLVEDLCYFLNNDDEVYRRHLFPVVSKYIDNMDTDRRPKMNSFRPAVEEGYRLYVKKFPIRELPNDIDSEVCKKVCEKMHEDTLKDLSDGKYKD